MPRDRRNLSRRVPRLLVVRFGCTRTGEAAAAVVVVDDELIPFVNEMAKMLGVLIVGRVGWKEKER
jgi:hypothetical protein